MLAYPTITVFNRLRETDHCIRGEAASTLMSKRTSSGFGMLDTPDRQVVSRMLEFLFALATDRPDGGLDVLSRDGRILATRQDS